VVSRQPITAVARFSPRGICRGQSGTGTIFSVKFFGFLHVMCNNIELEQTTSFECLGTIIPQNGKIEEVLNRVWKTNNIYYLLNQTIFGKKELNTNKGTRSIVTLRFGSNFAVWQ
jgi:hypothetical protein